MGSVTAIDTTTVPYRAVALAHDALGRLLDPVVGTSIWGREWDVLVVLDGCRHDLMADVVDEYPALPDSVGSYRSVGSCTGDWLRRTISRAPNNGLERTAYVTANPFSEYEAGPDQHGGEIALLDDVWRRAFRTVEGGIRTVPPREMTDAAIHHWRRRDQHGADQLIVHYMQPHEPFRARPDWRRELPHYPGTDGSGPPNVWAQARDGRLDPSDVWQAYRDNLHWALEDISERLIENVDATVAITSDHGNSLGDHGVWGHPSGVISPTVRRVPWLSLKADDDHTVSVSEPDTTTMEAAASDRLAALGYADPPEVADDD